MNIQSLLQIGRLPVAAILAAGPPSDRGGADPGPAGPEGERVGDDGTVSERKPEKRKPETNKELEPIPGPGAPMVPDHQNIDSNPIDPRVF